MNNLLQHLEAISSFELSCRMLLYLPTSCFGKVFVISVYCIHMLIAALYIKKYVLGFALELSNFKIIGTELYHDEEKVV